MKSGNEVNHVCKSDQKPKSAQTRLAGTEAKNTDTESDSCFATCRQPTGASGTHPARLDFASEGRRGNQICHESYDLDGFVGNGSAHPVLRRHTFLSGHLHDFRLTVATEHSKLQIKRPIVTGANDRERLESFETFT